MPQQKLIERANELYHNLINDYDETHEGISQEKERWEDAFEKINTKTGRTILDIGTGTGFVPLTISKFLNEKDTLICSDVSKKMLSIVEKKLKSSKFQLELKIIKEGSFGLDSNSVDIITINSVLHHIYNTEGFLKEIDRILKPKGILIIGHEPNSRHYQNKILNFYHFFLSFVFDTNRFIYSIAEKLYLNELLDKLFCLLSASRRKEVEKRDKIAIIINNKLIEEGLLKNPLTFREIIEKLIDVRVKEGFDPTTLLNYKILYLETFNHLTNIYIQNKNNKFIKKVEEHLKNKYPLDGGTFFIVMKK